MARLATEFRQAIARLTRARGFTAATVLTLGLAIAANAAIFAVVERVVLNPLPYPESDRLVQLDHGSDILHLQSSIGMTSGLYFQYERARTLDGLSVYRRAEATLVTAGEPARIDVARTTSTLSGVLRVPPQAGRWFAAEEDRPGAPHVAVLSHGLWVRRFGGDPQIVGRSIAIDGVPTQVIGVMPASFAFPNARIDAWLPAQMSPAAGFGLPFGYVGVGRLRAGATLADVRTELNALIANLPQVYPGDRGVAGNVVVTGHVVVAGLRSAPLTLKSATLGSIAGTLWVLVAAMALVLLVACANIANLFIVRSESRQREIAVRRALGAGTSGIARLFLAESTLLTTAGGVLGLALAWGAVRLLVANGPATLPRLNEIRLDGWAVAFTFALIAATALAFGSIPLWHRRNIADALVESGRGNTASSTRRHGRQALMGAQVALALVLLVAAALMLRSFARLRAIDPGFQPDGAITFRIALPEVRYRTRDAAAETHQMLLDRVAALPGVTAVSASSGLPLADTCFGNVIRIEGQTFDGSVTPPSARLCAVSGGYVEAMHMRLLRGRVVTRDDVARHLPNVVVNEALVRTALNGRDPLGLRIRSNAPIDGAPWLTIVGVVSNTPFTSITEPAPVPSVYLPMSISGGPDIPVLAMFGPSVSAMTFVVRSTTPEAALIPAIRQSIDSIDPALALAQVRTLDDIVAASSSQAAFTMVLLIIAAVIALALGVVGIYGVIAYVVGQRTGEIGIRMALGANSGSVVRMIVGEGAMVTACGLAAGGLVAAASSRWLQSLLYQVSPQDPVVLGGVTLTLLAVALLACWLPARRAALIDPLSAIRRIE